MIQEDLNPRIFQAGGGGLYHYTVEVVLKVIHDTFPLTSGYEMSSVAVILSVT